MSLTQFITDIGRPVAYYPSLKKITFSTNGSILLCQLLYWTDKTQDGWISKTADDLEDETGLTYEEQRTARAKLKELDLVEEFYDRTIHEMKYRVRQDTLNSRWELCGGKTTKTVEPKKDLEAQPKKEEKKDFIDLIKDQKEWPGFKKGELKIQIAGKIAKGLRINPDGKYWEDFIDYATTRQSLHNESVDTFIEYFIENNFQIVYFSPSKLRSIWPQAFAPVEKAVDRLDEFIAKPIRFSDKDDYVSIPDSIRRRNKE